MEREVRALEFEIRAEETDREDRAGRITGTPIVFNQWTDRGWCMEQIAPGALNQTDLRDVKFLVGHAYDSVPLARSRNNNENSTMQMTVTERGMEIRVDLDIQNNPRAKELYSGIKRGDISGMSFAFYVDKDRWDDIDTDMPKRTIESISKVVEVSAVAFPQYEGTDLQAASQDRSLDSGRASLESARKQLEAERNAQAEQERRTALLDRLNKLMEV